MAANEAMTLSEAVASGEELDERQAADILAGQFADEMPPDEDTDAGDELAADDVERAEEEAEADAPETEEIEVDSMGLEDLAEHFGVTPEDLLGKVKVKIKVDGKETEVNLGELRNGYQREADYTRKTQEVSARRKEMDEGVQRLSQFEQLAAVELQGNPWAQVEAQLQQEYQGTNWDELEQIDPGEAAAKQQRINRKWQEVQAAKTARAQQLYQLQQRIQATRQEYTAQEVGRLKSLLGWQDNEIPDRVDEMRKFLQTEYKVPDAMIAGISHAEFGLMVRDLMEFKKQSKAKASAETKQTKRTVKVLKPGTPKPAGSESRVKYDALLKRAKRTQSDDAWADALAAKLGY